MEKLDSLIQDELPDISVVIPAYNEESGITASLTQIVNFMNSFSIRDSSSDKVTPVAYEIIVVDDGSADKTAEIVENYAIYHPEIHLIKNPHKGKGVAVRTGMLSSRGKYILMADADMATPIEELKRLLTWVQEHDYDVVIASREGVGALRKNEPLIRHIMGRGFNFLVRLLVLPKINDTQCGFKLFTQNACAEIFSRMILFGDNTPETKRPRVSAFDVEVLVIAKRLGFKTKEIPVSWTYVKTNRVPPIRASIDNFLDVVKVKLNDLRGKYNKN